MKEKLTTPLLIQCARDFSIRQSSDYRAELFGQKNKKVLSTTVEQDFCEFLKARVDLDYRKSIVGLTLPAVHTDVKVVHALRRRSALRERDQHNLVYGLGHNLLIFIFEEEDFSALRKAKLRINHCIHVDASRTADYRTTSGLLQLLHDGGNTDDIADFLLHERHLDLSPQDLASLAADIVASPPLVGYLDITNTPPWRISYDTLLSLEGDLPGVTSII